VPVTGAFSTFTVGSLGSIASTAVSGCHDRICRGDLKRRIRALMPGKHLVRRAEMPGFPRGDHFRQCLSAEDSRGGPAAKIVRATEERERPDSLIRRAIAAIHQTAAEETKRTSSLGSTELVIDSRERDLGGFLIRRLLPSRERRMVGSFAFFDHVGPAVFPPGEGIQVRPHPPIGLATVTYLFDGEIIHRDTVSASCSQSNPVRSIS
jgi:hypothetical protein